MTGAESRSVWPGSLPRRIQAGVFALGFSCIITQLVLMREALSAFAGNELVLGVVLGNWLLLMGLGASWGRWLPWPRDRARAFAVILAILTVVPFVQVFVLRGLRRFVFLRGASLGMTETVFASCLIMLPYCLLAGHALAAACSSDNVTGQRPRQIQPSTTDSCATELAQAATCVYVLDSLAGVMGGALFSLVFVRFLDHFTALWVAAVLDVSAVAWLLLPVGPGGGFPSLSLAVSVIGCGVISLLGLKAAHFDQLSTRMQLPGQTLLFTGNSPYGRLVVAVSGGQTNFFENGLLLAAAPDIEQAEETAHYAMAQRPAAKRVLLIGGILSGVPKEVWRYGVDSVDCIEIDPLVIAVAKRFLPEVFTHPQIRVFEADTRQFIRNADQGYDVVIVAMPDPATAQLNRFFTREFFQDARRILRPDGVLSFGLGHFENYASPELISVLSCARQTASESFRNLRLIPGGRVYFIASNGPLTLDIASRLEAKNLSTRLVNRHYLGATLAPDRLADLERAASQPAPVNEDFEPILYLLHLRHWASQFSSFSKPLLAGLVGLMALYVLRLRSGASVIFASGFAGSSLEIVLLLGLQVLAGSVYRQVGLVVTMFMVGLTVGAAVAGWWLARPVPLVTGTPRPRPGLSIGTAHFSFSFALGAMALVVCALAVVTPWLLALLNNPSVRILSQSLSPWIVAAYAGGLAFVVGAQFPLANAADPGPGSAATRLYSADFVGASMGALLTSTLLVPVVGAVGACWIAGAMNLLVAAVAFWKGESA